ncbi:MAG: HesB/IscA family protein [Planctomycetota bacterium]
MIEVTERAIAEIKRITSEQNIPGSAGLRLGVKGGGCSGFSYTLGFEPSSRPGDQVFEAGGVRVFCDPKSILYLTGMKLDFEESLMGRGFKFVNPNAKHTCGCGQSFSA